MNTILFYKEENGKSPINDFLDNLRSKHALKVSWVLNLIEEHDQIPKTYFKKLVNTDDIWEVRAQSGNDIYRLLCFKSNNRIIVLTNGFQKKNKRRQKMKSYWLKKEKWTG